MNITGTTKYEDPTPQQNTYLHWFVRDLLGALNLTLADVYEHPQLSAKTPGEAQGLSW